ncbi:unnamed protein product [Phytophthora fragariaefolia]|uniref:Unnamed protein product n=1 Tax=Phytophthora fragariaefolia TaxID=1490495 RepID=A0A9W6Y7F5_9STRA|nr:unnamed protein product [Phytophthora fragariaefolia]
MDYVFGLPPDNKRRTGIVVFVDRFSKMVPLAAVPAEVTAKQTARLFVDMVFRHHGMPIDIVSDGDPRFTARFWQEVFTLLAVPTRVQTGRSPCNESTVSTPGIDTLNVNGQHTQTGPVVNKDAELNTEFRSKAMEFDQRRQTVIRFEQYAIAASVDRQKPNADNNGRGNTNEFKVGSLVLLATQSQAKYAVSGFGASKLAPRFIGPSTALAKYSNAYTLDIPSGMRLHPTFTLGG